MSFFDAIPDFAPALMISPDHSELFRNALFSLPPVSSPSALLPATTPITVTTADPIDGYSAEATALALLDSGVASDTRDVAFSLFFANAEATPWVPVSPVPISWSYDLDPNSPVFTESSGAPELVGTAGVWVMPGKDLFFFFFFAFSQWRFFLTSPRSHRARRALAPRRRLEQRSR